MSNTYFDFKQFRVWHNCCAMKVGTDGVLLGAWAKLPENGYVLDIGTGCGLLALMVAQRAPLIHVHAIDIDYDAVCQARENIEASPFASRISVEHSSLQDYLSNNNTKFDTIVCNPPFFEELLLPPDEARAAARHTDTLPFSVLISSACTLLIPNGMFNVILPSIAFDSFRQMCFASGLQLESLCHVRTTPRKEPKRVLAAFRKGDAKRIDDSELILQNGAARSADYSALTRDFYLY